MRKLILPVPFLLATALTACETAREPVGGAVSEHKLRHRLPFAACLAQPAFRLYHLPGDLWPFQLFFGCQILGPGRTSIVVAFA